MNIFIFKQHFYKYINKADFAIMLPAVVGTIATTFLNGYSSYLSDRNKRIERLNAKPLNHIYVDYISFEDYEKMIDRRNWKPASLRQKQEEEQKETVKINKKEKLINTVNEWLTKNTNKQKDKGNNDEVSAESLKQLSIDNKTATVESKNQSQVDKQLVNIKQKVNIDTNTNNENAKTNTIYKYRIIDSISKIGQSKNGQKTQNLPPMKIKIEEPKYFVVQSSVGGRRYDPEEFRARHAKQRIEQTTAVKKKVGKIGSKEIAKDDNIFQSMMHIWRKILFIKVDEKNQIINSKYDQYGNRIKDYESINMLKKNKKAKKSNVANKKNEYNKNSQEGVSENYTENIDKNDNINKIPSFIVPTFHIDGNLQKMSEYNKFREIATKNNLNAIDLQTLAYLEYIIENCWHSKYHEKYGNNVVDTSFVISYTRNMKPYEIQFEKIDPKLSKARQQSFKNDVIKMISSCDISYIKSIQQANYNLWGKIRIKFTKN